MQTNSQANSIRPNIIRTLILVMISIALAVVIGTVLFVLAEYQFTFYAENIGFIWLIMFLSALVFRIKYTEPIFVFNIILASFLVSFFAFGQGFIIVLLMLLFERLFKTI